MTTAMKRRMRITIGVLTIGGVLYATGELLQTSAGRSSTYLLLLASMVLQVGAFIVPCGALVASVLLALAKLRPRQVAVPIASSLGLAILLFGAGSWTQHLYGLDPPYVLFFLGIAMQFVALATPVCTVAWCGVVRARRRRRAWQTLRGW